MFNLLPLLDCVNVYTKDLTRNAENVILGTCCRASAEAAQQALE
jgi:hypothetical protein